MYNSRVSNNISESRQSSHNKNSLQLLNPGVQLTDTVTKERVLNISESVNVHNTELEGI